MRFPAGSSIAAPRAAGWVTDFLNAAYFARPRGARQVDDLRLAFCVLTTRWARSGGRRLGARDLPAFHRAFGVARLRARPRGTLDRRALLRGAAALLGEWFPEAYADDLRRAYGIAFPTVAEREAFDPGLRLRHAALGPLTPPRGDAADQHWATYPSVAQPSVGATAAFLAHPARWPDAGSEGGRFTALRPGGLEGQTFEIEVAAFPASRAPVFTRAYVSVTALHLRGRDDGLDAYVGDVNAALAAHAPGREVAVPPGATAHLALELTTHAGHFLGAARSRLLLYEDDAGGAWLRDVGSWDRLPWHLAQAYAAIGHEAQLAFWGPDRPEASMLAQIAYRARP